MVMERITTPFAHVYGIAGLRVWWSWWSHLSIKRSHHCDWKIVFSHTFCSNRMRMRNSILEKTYLPFKFDKTSVLFNSTHQRNREVALEYENGRIWDYKRGIFGGQRLHFFLDLDFFKLWLAWFWLARLWWLGLDNFKSANGNLGTHHNARWGMSFVTSSCTPSYSFVFSTLFSF